MCAGPEGASFPGSTSLSFRSQSRWKTLFRKRHLILLWRQALASVLIWIFPVSDAVSCLCTIQQRHFTLTEIPCTDWYWQILKIVVKTVCPFETTVDTGHSNNILINILINILLPSRQHLRYKSYSYWFQNMSMYNLFLTWLKKTVDP